MTMSLAARIVPFHIIVGPVDDEGRCPVHASAGSRVADAGLVLPEDLVTLGAQLLQPGARRVEPPVELGKALGRALFTPPLRALLLDTARAAAADDARLQLRLQINAPELATLPWEWLSLGGANGWMPAIRADYALVRLGRRVSPPSPLPLHGPLRILAVASPGNTHHLDALDRALASHVRDERIDLRLLADATPATLRSALADEPAHIVHIAARAALTLEQTLDLDLGAGIDALDLADLLAESTYLRLVTLTGGDGDGRTLNVGPALLGGLLLSDRLPAAVAFSAPLPASAAARFAAACYSRLAAGAPVDLAVTAGRAALAHPGNSSWGAPLLRLVPGAEYLFAPGPRRAARPRSSHRVTPFLAAAALCTALIAGGYLIRQTPAATPAPSTTRPTARIQAAPTGVRPAFAPLQLPIATPSVTPAPSATPAPSLTPAPSGYTVHTVAAGETLEGIAARLGSDTGAIAVLNAIDPAAPLRPERVLVAPLFRAGEPGSGLSEPVRHGNPASGKVALTFDIEIDDVTLYAILDALRQHEAKGTFFVTGNWVKRYPDAARAIVAGGHEIANHSLTHPYFSRIGLDGAAHEVQETERIVWETTGKSTRPYFRFPYGDSTHDTIAVVATVGFVPYHWSADDPAIGSWLDRAAADPARAAGGILLMHGRPATAGMLPGIIDRLRAMGLEPATLGETLR